jgi:hypothetical protein
VTQMEHNALAPSRTRYCPPSNWRQGRLHMAARVRWLLLSDRALVRAAAPRTANAGRCHRIGRSRMWHCCFHSFSSSLPLLRLPSALCLRGRSLHPPRLA